MRCNTRQDMPTEPHFAIMVFSRVFVPGDERSRTHPGHGYTDSYEDVTCYYAFSTQEEWEQEIRKYSSQSTTQFVAVRVTPAKITSSVQINVDLGA